MLLATLLSAAYQRPPAQVRFTIAEFTRPSSPFHGFFDPVWSLPHEVRIADRRTAAEELDDLADDLEARLEGSGSGLGRAEGSAPPERFFLLAGMHRWHELLAEGDYGRPSEISARLVRLADRGPDAGIHVVAWTDGYSTAERALRRAGLGFFGLRAVRALARFLVSAGEQSAAAELRIQLGREVWETHREPLRAVGNDMPAAAIEPAINALRAVLREVPEEYPDRNREINRFLPPLASAIHAIMKEQEADIPYHSRVEHIATGGVAKYPDIVKTSLDELSAEFEGICQRSDGKSTQGALCKTGCECRPSGPARAAGADPQTSTTTFFCITRPIK
jgi:hypothetical protein